MKRKKTPSVRISCKERKIRKKCYRDERKYGNGEGSRWRGKMKDMKNRNLFYDSHTRTEVEHQMPPRLNLTFNFLFMKLLDSTLY